MRELPADTSYFRNLSTTHHSAWVSGGRKITGSNVLGLQLVLMCELIAAAFPSTAVSRDCALVMVLHGTIQD